MPLSFSAMVGGTCTVIGTSTNILVSDIYANSNGGVGHSVHFYIYAYERLPALLPTM
jgi:Na+/H+ antiporter NhaD/arsenite permease-like protein